MATRKPANEVSFAEAIVSDAFNPGVRPQSFQALNYVFVALLTTAVIAAYLNNGSIHIYILLGLTTTLAFLINKYVSHARQDAYYHNLCVVQPHDIRLT